MRRVTAGLSTVLLVFAGCGAAPAVDKATPAGSAFYVSPTGNDRNPGTEAAPFATLARAQQAMKRSSIKATYV